MHETQHPKELHIHGSDVLSLVDEDLSKKRDLVWDEVACFGPLDCLFHLVIVTHRA